MLPRSAKLVVLLMIFLVVAGIPAWGQSWAGKGRLQGQVKDESGKPVEGATITLRVGTGQVDPKADGPKPLTTDKNGKWSTLGLTSGPWGVLIQKPGFMDSEGQVKVNEYAVAQPLVVTLKAPAKEVMQQAQKQNTQASEAKSALERGNALLQQGKYAEARAAYDEGMNKLSPEERAPLQTQVNLAVADSFYKEGKTDQAIETLKKTLAITPDDPDTLKLIVNLLAASGKEEEAKTYMAKLPQGTQIDPAISLNVGIKAFNAGKMDAALKEFNDVIANNPNLPEAYYYRAMVYLGKQQNKEAKADLQKLLQLDPNNKFASDAKEFLKEIK